QILAGDPKDKPILPSLYTHPRLSTPDPLQFQTLHYHQYPQCPRPRGSTFSGTSSQAAPQARPSALQMLVQEKQEPERHSKVQPSHSMMYYQPFSTTDPLN
ncbi:unnamed protein product, partial [Gulo gulo]